ncbi:M23 family metallopeptidase [Maricaulis maris]|uniref:Peptidase M23-like protein n=1 Tax=Maricaulis maris TaxID=74318 RepID=A0A495DPV2_9PROT|nr:M23 family metallopeptidase [Maricaulis maris]RKR04029.1 peptidase M23-like protein [Maricaulis maris]
MSEFDVTRADTRRTRGLVAFASLALSAGLLAALMLGGEPRSEAASTEAMSLAMAAPTDPANIVPVQDVDVEAAPRVLSAADLARVNDAAFTECRTCATRIQIERIVPRGGTMAGLLDDAGVDRVEAARAIAALGTVFDLRYLNIGERINLYFGADAAADGGEAATRFEGLSFRPDIERSITVARTFDDTFRARETIAEFDREMVRASGSITASLYVDALAAGATDRVVNELASVLAYAIDFQRSIQPGDEFDILFERFVDEEGHTARTGDILYAMYDGRGDAKEFFRYETEDGIVGYYSPEGASAQRLLMLTPVNGARLSSSFSRARRHPILGYTRRHNGTDFAAPTGTPVMAAGNGVVERADRYGSFGNYVRIRHANGYQTAYAHLNGFARGIRAGSRVTQGQVIAYVGTTGRSTGPHLHYEVHHNGTPRNPMTLDLPTGRQLSEDEIPLFEAERDRIIAIRNAARPAADTDTPIVADAGNGAQ